MKCTEAMAKRAHQAPPPTLSSRSKSPPMSGEGRASNSMAWVRIFKKPGGLKKSYQPGSMLSLALTKGLLNEPGQNSCFLNSAVQVLWQLDIFRRSLRQLSGHFCLGDSCIFCPLKSIFRQFQQSRERALPSDCLRNALAETFKDEQRFQLGLMDDAAECFENILERIHLHIVSDTATDACLSKSCITHQKFAMTLYEQFICRSCGASSDPHPFTELVHYISTTALCQQVDRIMAKNERLRSDMFGELLQAANTIGDPRRCPSNCGQSIKIRRVLMNCPEIVTIGFVWDAEQSDLTDDVIRSLGPCLHLSGLFNRVTDENAKRNELHLVGMICFASKHYSAFAYHTKSSKWMFFDDATVKEIGSKWKDVASKCIRGHFQPLLLFYTNPEGGPISCEDAPRQTTLCSRYKAQLNGEVTATGSKKLDADKEHAGPHQAHIQPLPSSWTSGIGREKLPLGSPNTFSEPLIYNAQRSGESTKKVRGQRRAEQYQQKENGMRPFADQTVKRSSRTERPSSHSNRSCHEPREPRSSGVHDGGHSHRNSASPAHCNQDGCQEEWEKSGSGGSRSRSTWRPVREVLNVDSVLNELEQRRQQHRDKAHCNKPSSQERALNAEGDLTLDQEVNRNREGRKLKCLMTIYEDEQRHEMESHSSLDSESQSKQQRGDRPTGGPRTLLRSDTWTIQRTESGYESSDRLSSGSTNPDSPGIDALAIKDHTFIPESHLISQPHQNGGDTSQSVLRSPSHNSKHQPKTQGKNSDAVSHSHLKSSPNSRRKSKHNTSSSRRGAPCNHDSRSGQSEHQEPGSGRGHGIECPGQRGVAKTSSSEWNNSDELALFEAEERDSAYSNSEAAASDSQSSPTSHPYRTHGTSAVPPQPRPDYCVHSQAGEASPGVFRPWQLQEPFPPSPRPSSRSAGCYASLPHRKAHVLARPGLDAGSRWDPEKSTSCESKDRLPGCRPAALVVEQEVALTRYFNVDSCMTETYRLRYHHQRPLVLSATVPHAEHGGTGHFLTMDTHSDMPYNRPDTSHNSNKTTVKWNKVTTKGLDEHGFL